MPFIPHTQQDIDTMLETLELNNINDVFSDIPKDIPKTDLEHIPEPLNEIDISRLMKQRQPNLEGERLFIGAGSYWHHIPACIWQLASRGEFYTAYTPYQAEASQGSLQVIYEYQSMMAHLMGMDMSNASLYEGASATVEAVLMALRIKKGKCTRILVPDNLNPRYRAVLQTFLAHQHATLETLAFDPNTGRIDVNALKHIETSGLCALIINQPNFFGQLEDVDTLTQFAHKHDALVIGVVNPLAMAITKEPGAWGEHGADIACGEGQPLGIPMAGGGPYFGFMCCKKKYARQIPGRIVGRTVDQKNQPCFVLTLQAREQHIRRAKATSNICTNQGLAVTAATIYMSLMGFQGLVDVASRSHQNALIFQEKLSAIAGVELVFTGPLFHEFVIRLTHGSVEEAILALDFQSINAGHIIEVDYPQLTNCLLVCTTELITETDMDDYVAALSTLETDDAIV